MDTATEIICVGNELLTGITNNTNATWLGKRIFAAGALVKRVTVVGDDLEEISTSIKESLDRNPDFIIMTGGLGATYDDMTFEGVAKALGKKLFRDPVAVEMLRQSYARRSLNYEVNEVRLKMATIPEGSTPLENPVGSAPSIAINAKNKTKIFCLPGVPAEMEEIFNRHIMPEIKKMAGEFFTEEINYSVSGVSEAMIAPALSRIVNSTPKDSLYLKTHPQGYGADNIPRIRVQIVSKGKDVGKVKKVLDTISAEILGEIKNLGGSAK